MAYFILKSYKLKVTALEIFSVFKHQRRCFFLDSCLAPHNALGRFSFLGIEPFYILQSKEQNPFQKLRELLNRYKITSPKGLFPFWAGAAGYLSYDLGFDLEQRLKPRPKEDLGIPECYFGFYNTVVVIDHLKKCLYILAVGFPETNSSLAKLLCESNLKKILKLLPQISGQGSSDARRNYKGKPEVLKSNFSKEGYISAIRRAKGYIKRGDIYQVNLSQRFESQTSLSGAQIYQRLRSISPSYFNAYLDAEDFQLLSSSPERFLKLENDTATTRPMKGTRPRGKNKIQDCALKEELLNSAKDRAELVMIVDLERNDLGKVCSYKSIKVNTLRELEEYSTVFQTTATISGQLHRDKDRIDLLRACSPGGSVTGCPKIRAMEIIEELEPTRRSIYTGSLGYLSFAGDMDFNILIRTILKTKHKLYFGVGGGIVADSRPEDEYEETLVKARAMVQAIA